MILQVMDSRGAALESYADNPEQVGDAEPIREVNDILSDTEARSTLFQSSLNLTIFPNHEVALKTGTSNDYRDAWAMGYTPSLVAGVWAGNNDNAPMQRHGSSILAAVPIWSDFMRQALQTEPSDTFTKPAPIAEQKAVLVGDYSQEREIHTILYYVDKNNPVGQPPANPADDPQYTNWETGVQNWLQQNAGGMIVLNSAGLNKNPNALLSARPAIHIDSPATGSFVAQKEITVIARIDGKNIAKARVYWNGALVQEFANIGESYQLVWSFSPPIINDQNLLEVEAVTSGGISEKSSAILYK